MIEDATLHLSHFGRWTPGIWSSYLDQGGYRVDFMEILQDALNQVSDGQADSPGGVTLQLDDLIGTI